MRTAKARRHEIGWYVWAILGNTLLLGPMHRDGIQNMVQVNYFFFFFHEASGTFCCSWKREPFLYGSKNHTHRTQHSLRKIYSQPIRKDYAKRYILRFRYYVFELRSLEGKKQIQPQIFKLSQPILDSEGRESESESRSVLFASLWPHGLYRPWNSPDQNAGVGSLSVLQGIFPTQGSNPGLPHCRRILYQLSHKGSLRVLE